MNTIVTRIETRILKEAERIAHDELCIAENNGPYDMAFWIVGTPGYILAYHPFDRVIEKFYARWDAAYTELHESGLLL